MFDVRCSPFLLVFFGSTLDVRCSHFSPALEMLASRMCGNCRQRETEISVDSWRQSTTLSIMPLMSIQAHYDGVQVLLDEKVALRRNSRLIVTVLEDADEDREDFMRMAASGLAAAYSDDDVEYTETDLKR